MTTIERVPLVIRRDASDGTDFVPNPYDRESLGVTVYKVGGRVYPFKRVPQCSVCTSPVRTQIESRLLEGAGFTAITRDIPDGVPPISVKALRNHSRNHLPVELHVKRQIMEDRANEIGRSIEMDGAIIDHIGMARLVIQRTIERLARGEIEPELADGLAAAQFLARVEKVGGDDLDQEVIRKAFITWAETIQANVPPEVFGEIMRQIGGHPVMRALIAQQSQVIDADADDTHPQEEDAHV